MNEHTGTHIDAPLHFTADGKSLRFLVADDMSVYLAQVPVTGGTVERLTSGQRVLGAYGCARDYDMERYVRDLLVMPIVGGSSKMQKNNIANRLKLGA